MRWSKTNAFICFFCLKKMADIIKEIMKFIPADKISSAEYEAADIVLYTKDKDFFLNSESTIKELVNEFKKRIELRPDPDITLDQEKTKKIISELATDANITDFIFDSQRSRVIIHAEKPGLVIGKQGAILREIKEKTSWVPIIFRTPPIRSKLIEGIRNVLYENSDYRRKFLNKVGHRIYDGWQRGKKHEWVRISFLGAARQVGRSCLLLQTPESRVMLDCGIDIASIQQAEQFPFLDAPEFKLEDLDAIIITHSHLDHCYLVPYLYKFGYKGPVYCTAPTRDVMALLQLDTIKIAMNEGRDPHYSVEDIKEMIKHTICLDWEEVTDITPDVRLTLYNSGHILGSSMVHLHVGNGLHNILYTSDMKFSRTNIYEAAATSFPRLETMIIESTYGGSDDLSPPRKEADEQFKEKLANVIKNKGKMLMPVLGSGRAQQLMMLISELVRKKEIAPINVYLEGMLWDITAIHTAYPEYLNINVRKQIFHKDENPFLNEIFKRVGSAEERRLVIEEEGTCVILATSGMLVGGPSVEYLKQLGDNARNSLVFTCYQGEGSLGRRILNGDKELTFKNGAQSEVVPLKIEVYKMSLSDHSDREELMNFIASCDPKPRRVIIQHGESSKVLDLASSIHKQFKIETNAPRNLEAIRLR